MTFHLKLQIGSGVQFLNPHVKLCFWTLPGLTSGSLKSGSAKEQTVPGAGYMSQTAMPRPKRRRTWKETGWKTAGKSNGEEEKNTKKEKKQWERKKKRERAVILRYDFSLGVAKPIPTMQQGSADPVVVTPECSFQFSGSILTQELIKYNFPSSKVKMCNSGSFARFRIDASMRTTAGPWRTENATTYAFGLPSFMHHLLICSLWNFMVFLYMMRFLCHFYAPSELQPISLSAQEKGACSSVSIPKSFAWELKYTSLYMSPTEKVLLARKFITKGFSFWSLV